MYSVSLQLHRLISGPLALCTLEAQEVTTTGVYRLPHAIYYCSLPVSDSPRATLVGDHE